MSVPALPGRSARAACAQEVWHAPCPSNSLITDDNDSTPGQGRRCDMYSVLLQEDPVQVTAENNSSFQVKVTVLVTGPKSSDVSFEPARADNYKVEAQSVLLVGSGGSPREFV